MSSRRKNKTAHLEEAIPRTRVTDSPNGRFLVNVPIDAHSSLNRSLAWASDGKQLFASSRDGNVDRLDVSTGPTLSQWAIHSDNLPRCHLSWHRESNTTLNRLAMLESWSMAVSLAPRSPLAQYSLFSIASANLCLKNDRVGTTSSPETRRSTKPMYDAGRAKGPLMKSRNDGVRELKDVRVREQQAAITLGLSRDGGAV